MNIRDSLPICKTKQGQNFLIISSLNANAKSSNFYLKTKGDIQDFLKIAN
jgi:hypothetical protein